VDASITGNQLPVGGGAGSACGAGARTGAIRQRLTTPAWSIEIDVTGADATAVIAGELDITATLPLRRQLRHIVDACPRRLSIDAAGIGFIDCAATRVVVDAGRSLPPGHKPVIHSPSPAMLLVLRLTGLASQCELVPGAPHDGGPPTGRW
jgi:anti-anti-sigma factor